MIRYLQGNLLDSDAEAIVNTVNEVGVMGKGIALMLKEAFPDNTTAYAQASREKKIQVGRMFVTENRTLIGPRWLINFPTKKHWRHPSRFEWIREGLKDLVRVIQDKNIRSIAVPPLGCGNGGLEWSQVRPEIESALGKMAHVEVIVYEPTKAYVNESKKAGWEKLTPARALIVELVRRYSILGIECSHLEVQKLAWFLQRTIERMDLNDPLKLGFVAHTYGPYADNLRHLLNGLDGSYLHCEKRLADASPMEPIYFIDSRIEEVGEYLRGAESAVYLNALNATENLIDGFQSPLGMELLATVDWLISEGGCDPNPKAVLDGLIGWPGGETAGIRKAKLFDERLVGLALEKLKSTA